jgi:hypothetical protein
MGLFGKKAFQIKFDKNTFKNVAKNAIGLAGASTGGLLGFGLANEINKLIDPSKPGGGGGPAGPNTTQDLTQKYLGAQEQQRLKNLETSGQLTEQLRQQAMGEGPLAGAQLKTAQTRNLAQTLAAAQSAGANPLAQRQMLQQRGAQGQELAQLGMQERLGAQQALGAQVGQQAGMSRADIESAYGIGMTPEKMAQERAMQQARIQAEKDAAHRAQNAQLLGGVLQGGAQLLMASDEKLKKAPQQSKYSSKDKEEESDSKESNFEKEVKSAKAPTNLGEAIANIGSMGAGYIKDKKALAAPPSLGSTAKPSFMSAVSKMLSSDEQQKTSSENKKTKLPSAKNEVNDMMDSLEPKKYEYKNPQMPGAAPGTRYGIIAQDLEKSSLGKTLVKNTPHGKMVDTVQGFGAVLAAQAELNRRLKKIEKKGK